MCTNDICGTKAGPDSIHSSLPNAPLFAPLPVMSQGLTRLHDADGSVTSLQRLLAGSAAGATAVAVTYPLDLLRARLAVRANQTARGAWWEAVTGGTGSVSILGLYRGLNPTLLGILPYAGIVFLTRDTLNHMAAKRYDTSSLHTPLAAKVSSGAVRRRPYKAPLQPCWVRVLSPDRTP